MLILRGAGTVSGRGRVAGSTPALSTIAACALAILCFTVSAQVTRVIDGDTFVATVSIWHGLTSQETVRVLGVNAPERHGATRVAGDTAAMFATGWVAESAGAVELVTCKRDAFGRALADVRRPGSGALLSEALIASGNGVPFMVGK